jgi:hypothetical protein
VAKELGQVSTAAEAAAIEAALRVVPGVAAAVVVPDDVGGPGILRLTLDAGSDEVVVARSVHRILRMQFGVGLDPGRIEMVEESTPEPVLPVYPALRVVEESVDDLGALGIEIDALLASIGPGTVPPPRYDTEVLTSAARHPAGTRSHGSGIAEPSAVSAGSSVGATSDDPARLAIVKLILAADGLGVSATVTLSRGVHEFSGTVDGASSGTAVNRVVAAATLTALSDVLGPEHRVDVEAVSVTSMGDGQVAVVQVLWATADGSQRLTGASEVREDPRQAVIRATLDAVNRRLAPHLDQ